MVRGVGGGKSTLDKFPPAAVADPVCPVLFQQRGSLLPGVMCFGISALMAGNPPLLRHEFIASASWHGYYRNLITRGVSNWWVLAVGNDGGECALQG